MLSKSNQCNDIKNIYTELLKSDEPENLIKLATLQYKCVKELMDNGTTKVFRLESQIELRKAITKLISERIFQLLELDTYNTSAVIILMGYLSDALLKSKEVPNEISKADLAESAAYYINELIKDKNIKFSHSLLSEKYQKSGKYPT